MLEREQISEMRGAVRFPVHLPIAVRSNSEEHEAQTLDISAGGMLINIDADMTVGANIEFTISIPADVIGSPTDILVSGAGRVVRCASEKGRNSVAAVIDEYRFERS